jgi:hypothetical protein
MLFNIIFETFRKYKLFFNLSIDRILIIQTHKKLS